jgi:hypothetical protein
MYLCFLVTGGGIAKKLQLYDQSIKMPATKPKKLSGGLALMDA